MNKTLTALADDAKEICVKFDRIARRAVKLGLPVPTLTEIERKIEKHEERAVKVVVFQITGEVPRVDGWEFIASLHHIEGANIAIGAHCDIPEQYKNVGPDCDHCGLKRNRRDTYLLRSEQGEWKQVGRSCLGDFLRSDFHLAVFHAQMIEDMEGLTVAYSGRVGISAGHNLQTYLTWVAATIREREWISSKRAFACGEDPTWQIAREAMINFDAWQENEKKDAEDRSPIPEPAIKTTLHDAVAAFASIEWASSLEPAEHEDYLWNLRAVSMARTVDHRLMGLAASMLVARENAEKRVANAAYAAKSRELNVTSEHFGTVGERQIYTLTVERTKEIETAYGVSTLVIFRDQHGNAAKWFASGTPEGFESDTIVTVKATVKAHDEYSGTKQTSLSRVAIYVPKEPKKKKSDSIG